jgi:hypothetical protein
MPWRMRPRRVAIRKLLVEAAKWHELQRTQHESTQKSTGEEQNLY